MLIQKMIMTRQVYIQICKDIGGRHAESGGMLGSSDGGRTIDYFFFDSSARTTRGTYSPDTAVLNRVLKAWNAFGIILVGFVHSHPWGNTVPSAPDRIYVKDIREALAIPGFFYMPIVNVNSPPDGNIRIFPYALDERLRLHKLQLEIVEEDGKAHESKQETMTTPDMIAAERFDRIKHLYPLETLRRKTIVCVGCGGTRQFIEDMARSGVGNFVLIDGDIVSATNVATQHTFISEIGRNKAEVIRDRILDINPEANVKVVPRFLDDAMTDSEFVNIVGETLTKTPADTLLCGCTDSFFAQARTATLAMKYGTPYLAAQLYRGGLAAEVYFSYPGVTNSGCPRCALASRYRAYENGYKNNVTSDGTPISATTHVNAIKGQIALMLLLYHEDKDCVYSDMLDKVADRNFVMIRMSPKADRTLGIGIFQEALRAESGLIFCDETVWIPQTPNNGADGSPPCPLCGGTGNLLALKGKIRDTRTDW